MAVTTFSITHARASDYQGKASMDARTAMARVLGFLSGCMGGSLRATSLAVGSGNASGTVTLSGTTGTAASGTVFLTDVGGVQASGTVTLGGGAGNVTIVVGGTSVGPVAFSVSDAQTATNCITALNANVTVAALVTASSGGSGVIALTANNYGAAGNAITLTASRSAGTAVASGATLANGADGEVTVTVNGTAVVTDVTNLTDPDAADAIALSINEDETLGALVSASGDGEEITITWGVKGTVGNAVTLTSSSDAGSAIASGATLSGGANNAVAVTVNGVALNTNTTTAADDTAAAVLVADTINASVNALVSGLVSASSASNVVTVTAVSAGPVGNQTTLASSATSGTATASGTRLTGGTSTTYTF